VSPPEGPAAPAGKAEAAARRLLAARAGPAIAALDPGERPADVAGGYAIQDRVVALSGAAVRGWKIGCTSQAARTMLRYDAPFYGRLVDGRFHTSPARLPDEAFRMRLLEAEYAFRLGRDLPGRERPYTEDEVAAAIDAVHPAVEVVDSAYVDWLGVGIASVIADNGSHGAFVLGQPRADWRAVDRIGGVVTMAVDGVAPSEGSGANVMGDPLTALAWLVEQRRPHGGLAAGEIVTTGTATPPVMCPSGGRAVATFAGLGRVELAFG